MGKLISHIFTKTYNIFICPEEIVRKWRFVERRRSPLQLIMRELRRNGRRIHLEQQVSINLEQMPLLRSVDHCVAGRPFVHRDRIINHHVLLYMTKGEMCIWEEGVEYCVREGSALFLRAGAHHWGEKTIPAGTEWYYLHFYCDWDLDKEPFDRNAITPQSQYFTKKDYQWRITFPKLFQVQDENQLTELLEDMRELFFSSDPLRHIHLTTRLGALLLILYKNEKPNALMDHTEMVVRDIVHFLKSNVNRSLSSKEISDHMHLSYQYLCAIFKRKNQVSILVYHTNLRIAEACRLLRETRLNISEVSDSIGYSNPFYFSNVFKKIIGKSPRNYLDDITRHGDAVLYEENGDNDERFSVRDTVARLEASIYDYGNLLDS